MDQYQPIIVCVETPPVTTLPGGSGHIWDVCLVCDTSITEAPYYKVFVPQYIGQAYYCDNTVFACCLEHAQQLKTEQVDEDELASEALPSGSNEETKRRGWIYAFHDKAGYPRDTERSGKWLVFAPATNIDMTWMQFKRALHQGSFGRVMKVATRPRLDRRENIMKHVICVYTYDYEDKQDVKRVRQALRSLGVTWKIGYKDDETTNNFQYASNSSKPVSRYWE